MAGFECSSHRRQDGRRLDLIEATAHDRHVEADYAAVRRHGMATVRDGLRWHLVEQQPGRYAWDSFLPMLEAAERRGMQVIWDLCHYGWPDDIDIFRPSFVERFSAFARAVARLVRDRSDEVPFYCPVNEVSFWSWAGGDQALMNPLARGRGLELKHQLVRASIVAIEAIREVDPRARFVHVDPLVRIAARNEAEEEEAAALCRVQYDAALLLSGELWPGLGGQASYLDIVGVNYYGDNQWFLDRETILPGHPLYRPPRELFVEAHRRLGRPILVAETGAEGDARVPWLRHVFEEVGAAMDDGVPIEGVCLYPVLDYPGWTNERHCPTGLFGVADRDGIRPLHAGMAEELARRQERFAGFAGPAGPH
jgi:beta-glucosidase/6-phospho-beta-glucosidase/beta-galactosidase